MTLAERIAETLLSRRVLLLNHVSPDGDCLGSTLALARALRAHGQHAVVGSSDGVPDMYRFLPGADQVVTDVGADAPFGAAVFMECSTPDRAGALAGRAVGAPLWVNIDHHVSNGGYGDLILYDPAAAAVGELVTPIVQALGPIDAPAATCLMTALLTDTGSFRYTSVTPRTLRIAADLVQAGASPADVYTRVYENRPASAFRLLAMALGRLELSSDGRIAWTSVTQDMLRASGAPMEESEGIVGQLRAIAGVQVALLFKEEPDGIRVSLRARAGIRANIIAEAFGGGGHAAAAGFTATGPLPDVMRRTIAAVQQELAAGAVS